MIETTIIETDIPVTAPEPEAVTTVIETSITEIITDITEFTTTEGTTTASTTTDPTMSDLLQSVKNIEQIQSYNFGIIICAITVFFCSVIVKTFFKGV